MSRLSQKELLVEFGFLNGVRAAASAAKAAVLAVAPEIGNDLKRLASPITGAYKAVRNQTPVLFLKDLLAKKTNIEFNKLVTQDKRPANPNKPWYKRIYGPKSVTLVTFTAFVYHKGKTRDYRMYKEAIGKALPKVLPKVLPKKPLPKGPKPKEPLPKEPLPKEPLPKGPLPKDPLPKRPLNPKKPQSEEPEVDTLTAEIFRTSEGLQIGDIYSTKTGRIFYSEKEKSLPIFNNDVVKYKDPATGNYTVKNLIAFLTREIGLSNSMAKNINQNANNLSDLISITTGVKSDLNAIVPAANLDKLRAALYPLYVESTNSIVINKNIQISQFNLIEQLVDLK
jgi:hypothetical protein